MQWYDYLQYVVWGLTGLSAVLGILAGLVSKSKAKSVLLKSSEVAARASVIVDAVKDACITAEFDPDCRNGVDKKLDLAIRILRERINLKPEEEYIAIEEINKLVSASKKINVGVKDMNEKTLKMVEQLKEFDSGFELELQSYLQTKIDQVIPKSRKGVLTLLDPSFGNATFAAGGVYKTVNKATGQTEYFKFQEEI